MRASPEGSHPEIVDFSLEMPAHPIALMPVGRFRPKPSGAPIFFSKGLTHGKTYVVGLNHSEIPGAFLVADAVGHGQLGFRLCAALRPQAAPRTNQVRNANALPLYLFPELGFRG